MVYSIVVTDATYENSGCHQLCILSQVDGERVGSKYRGSALVPLDLENEHEEELKNDQTYILHSIIMHKLLIKLH